VPEAVQDGSPTSDQARWQGIYIHTPTFTIITIAGQDGQMGPEARFARVVEAPAGSDGPAQRQPEGRQKSEPDFGKRFDDSTELVEVRARRSHSRAVEGPAPPTPSPVAQGRGTAGKRQGRKSAGNGVGSGQRSQTAETPSVVKSAEHWRREARPATEPLMFDTAVSRLEPWFKDANAAGAFRETLFEGWQPELVGFYLEALLRYAQVRKVLEGLPSS
jgi:hypothetical protein